MRVCRMCVPAVCTQAVHQSPTRGSSSFSSIFSFALAFILEWAFCIFLCMFALVCFCVFAAQQTRSINMHTLTHSHKHNCNYVWISIEFPKLKTHKTKHVNRLEHNNDTHLFLNGFSMLFFCSLSSLF